MFGRQAAVLSLYQMARIANRRMRVKEKISASLPYGGSLLCRYCGLRDPIPSTIPQFRRRRVRRSLARQAGVMLSARALVRACEARSKHNREVPRLPPTAILGLLLRKEGTGPHLSDSAAAAESRAYSGRGTRTLPSRPTFLLPPADG